MERWDIKPENLLLQMELNKRQEEKMKEEAEKEKEKKKRLRSKSDIGSNQQTPRFGSKAKLDPDYHRTFGFHGLRNLK